jgi:hypothetical protein
MDKKANPPGSRGISLTLKTTNMKNSIAIVTGSFCGCLVSVEYFITKSYTVEKFFAPETALTVYWDF